MSLKIALSTAALTAALFTPVTTAQEPTTPAEPAPEAAPTEPAPSVDDLIDELGDASYRVRKAATEKLAEIGEAAISDLHHAAEDHDDPEVRMRAARILRQIERGTEPRPTLRRRVAAPRALAEPRRFGVEEDDIRQMVERLLRERLPQHDEVMRQLERAHFPQFEWDLDDQHWSARESVSIQIGPDGVRVEVEDAEGDDSENKVWEAEDMESFRKQYPEIAKRYLGGRGFGVLRLGAPQTATPLFELDTEGPRVRGLHRLETVEEAPPPGRRLGVYVDAVDPAVAEFLGFDEGEGLKVTSVADDSLAEDLGIRAGDVLLEVGGQRVATRADVAKALGAIEVGAEVAVVVNRRGREVELSAEKR